MSHHFEQRNPSQGGKRPPDVEFDIKYGLERISRWLTEKIDADAIKFTEDFGKYLNSQQFTTAQIRKIYGEVKMLQQKGWEGDKTLTALLLLKPKLSYSAKRIDKKCAWQFKEFLSTGIDVIYTTKANQAQSFENFVNLFEAILAYHRASGGK